MKNRKIIIGSRGSKLALIYAEKAREKILNHSKDFGFEEVIIKEIITKGDQVQDKRLSEVGGKGLFSKTIEVECDTISNMLSGLNIKNLDYLKVDTQGAELEILNGIGNYRPLLIKIETHIFSMYSNVPSWHKLLNYLY